MMGKHFQLMHLCLIVFIPSWSLAFHSSLGAGSIQYKAQSLANANPRPFIPILRENTQLLATEQEADSEVSALSTFWIFALVPALSLGFPYLLQAKMAVALFIAKRAYIYLMATTVLVVASMRGASDSPLLGSRLIDLTREILPDLSMDQDDDDSGADQRFQEMKILDEVEGSSQAVGLPLIVVSSLVASLFFVLLQNGEFTPDESLASGDLDQFFESVRTVLPQLVTASNAIVIALFARAELRRGTSFLGDNADAISLLGALILSGLAYLGPASLVWPVQNVVCMCLAIAVSRAIQLPRLGPILLALSALVAYDVVSVGLQLVDLGSASLASGQGTSDAASSAMGAVALSKAGLTSSASGGSNIVPTWQPGLFEVRLRGAVTDLLGLGDAVFPSLLSTFCVRYDQEDPSRNYFGASLVGFGAGCVACEFAPGVSDSGLPALLFIVPAMLTAVFGLAVLQGNVESLVSFDAELTEEL